MKKSIFLFFAAILCAIGANAKTIYLKPSNNWKEASAWFQVWDGQNNVTFEETAVSGLYKADIANNHDSKIYIKRKQPNTDNTWAEGSVTVGTYNCFSNDGWSTSMTRSNIIGVVAGGYILFDNSQTNWSDGYRYFVIGHDSYYKTIGGNSASTLVSNTKLWCVDANSESWADAKYFAFLSHNGEYPKANKPWSDIETWGKQKTSQYTSSYSLYKNSIYLCVPTSGTGKPEFTISYKDSHSALNNVINVKTKLSTDDGVNYIEANVPCNLQASSYEFSAWNKCNTATSLTSGSISCGYTANTTLTAQTDVVDYEFVGWYDEAGVQQTTNATLNLNPKEGATYYAYYKSLAEETHEVTISYKCGNEVIQIDDAPTSATVGESTEIPVSAPPVDGYKFANWTLGAGVATTDALTANPINITTKADETDYTITANYEEDLTTDWVLKGSFVDDFATAYNFEKKSGESTGTVAYVSMNLAANTAYEFKVVKGGSNWYGNNNTDEEYWIKNTIENWTFEQHKDNCHMKSELAGSYTFKIDYSDANPKVSVYYPDAPVKAVKIAGTMTGWEDSPVAFTIDGTIATLSIELTQGYHQFKIIETVTVDATDKDNWYGNGGTMTRKNCTEWTFNSGDNNATIFADADGAYTFKWDITTNKLSVTNMPKFPDLSHQPATLYFKPSTNWKENNAKFAAYFCYGDIGTDDKWVEMTPENGIYKVSNSDKKYVIVIFVRLNPDGEISWESQWNQTDNLIIPNTPNNLNTCFAFWKNSWEDVSGLWVAPTPLTDNNWADFIDAYKDKTINALIERSFKSGQYHTLCLPFDIPTNWLGEGTEAYQLTSIAANNTGDKLSLNATKWETIVAGQPYIIVPVKGSEYEHVIINGVTVKNVSAGTNVASGDGYKATLKAVTATDGTQTNGSTEYYVGANDGKLYNTQTNKLGLRAIIELTTIGGQPLPPKVRAQVTTGENVETGVDNIATTDTPVKAIENGQLIIIRDGVKYNVQGQKL